MRNCSQYPWCIVLEESVLRSNALIGILKVAGGGPYFKPKKLVGRSCMGRPRVGVLLYTQSCVLEPRATHL